MFTEAWPPLSGGVATSAHRVATSLAELGGHEVTVFTFDSSEVVTSPPYVKEATVAVAGVKVLKFGPFFLKRPSDEIAGINEKHRAILRRQVFDRMVEAVDAMPTRPELVFSMYVVNAGWMATYLANHMDVPHVLGVRGNDVGRNIFSVDRLYPVALAVRNAAAVVCVNSHLRERLMLAFPEAGEKTRMIENSCRLPVLPVMDQAAARSTLLGRAGWPDSSVVVSFIGAAREKKGIRALLAALLEPGVSRDLRLALIGSRPTAADQRLFGDLWARLEDEGRLFCSGQLDRAEALGLALGSDIGTMPSIEDGLANGLLESICLGLPVVVSDLFSEVVVEGVSGLVARRNDVAGLAAALTQLARDAGLRAAMGRAALERATERYSPQFEVTNYEEVFSCVLKRSLSSAPL